MQLKITEELDKKLKRLKDRKQLNIIKKKVIQILKNPEHFKPLKGSLHGTRRVHIKKSFVLTYEIKEDTVILLDYEHHDKIY